MMLSVMTAALLEEESGMRWDERFAMAMVMIHLVLRAEHQKAARWPQMLEHRRLATAWDHANWAPGPADDEQYRREAGCLCLDCAPEKASTRHELL